MLLEIRDLVARYGAVEALHGIAIDVAEGEIVSLLGANGAGKSTTLKVISRVIAPAAGAITREITLSVVLLPAPLAPSSETISPSATSIAIPCSASTAP